MIQEYHLERFFEALTSGDRPEARGCVSELTEAGADAQDLLVDLFWPTYESVETMFRKDKLSTLAHHYATRTLRMLVDQNASRLSYEPRNAKRVMAYSGPSEQDELAGQMAVDLIEASGFTVNYAGGGIPNDEILAELHQDQPDVLLLFAASPSDLPEFRGLIDTLHEIGACPNMQIAVAAGVFNRADGLAEEIGVDLWADDPLELAERLIEEPQRRAERPAAQPTRRKRAA